MILREVLVRPGIVSSKRVCALAPATQLFFRNLLHVCDGAGRFEADVDELRTVLYGRALDRVSRAHVSRWLVECQQAELIDLYTEKGRGYGEVRNYGQRDTKRKVRYPAKPPPDPNELPLTSSPPPGADAAPPPRSPRPPAASEPNEIEVSESARSAPHTPTDDEWLAGLAREWPDVDVRAELRKCQKKFPQTGRKFFADEWLPRVEQPVKLAGPASKPAAIEPEPEAWKLYLRERYEGESWAGSAAIYTWAELPPNWRAKIAREMNASA